MENEVKNRINFTIIILIGFVIFFVSACGGGKVKTDPEKGFVFFPQLPAEPRYQYLTTFSTSDDVKKKSALFKFVAGSKETKPIPIKKPYGVAMHDGTIYVCDLRSNAIIVMDLKNKEFGFIGATGPGKLIKPSNIVIDKNDRLLYVADTIREQIVVFNLSGRLVKVFGKKGDYKPVDVEIYNNELFVSDLISHQILVINKKTGKIKKRIGEKGHKEGMLYHPTNIAVRNNKLYVSDTTNFRISIFDVRGNYIGKIGSIGTRPGTFTRPKGIAVDKNERIYVVDAAFENLQIFNKRKELLLYMLGPGRERFNVKLPAAVYIDYDNLEYFRKYISPNFIPDYLLFVTSNFGANMVNVYAFGKYEKK